jgi:hypothetical protein
VSSTPSNLIEPPTIRPGGGSPDDAERSHRLPAPGLADDAKDLAGAQLERDPLHGLHDAALRREVRVQVADLEEGLGGSGHPRTTGSSSADGCSASWYTVLSATTPLVAR